MVYFTILSCHALPLFDENFQFCTLITLNFSSVQYVVFVIMLKFYLFILFIYGKIYNYMFFIMTFIMANNDVYEVGLLC